MGRKIDDPSIPQDMGAEAAPEAMATMPEPPRPSGGTRAAQPKRSAPYVRCGMSPIKASTPDMEYDYPRATYALSRHHERYAKYVAENGRPCQECGGAGGEIEPLLDYGEGPWMDCGFCEGEGLWTRWIQGWWLRWKKMEKHERENKAE